MSTSIAKIEANRANAKRSTGPRTEAAKRRTRYNAVKHGWRAKMPIPQGEDAVLFEQVRGQLVRTFGAVTAPEQFLCARVALAMWRGFRSTRAETQTIGRITDTIVVCADQTDDPAASALSELFLTPHSAYKLTQLVRYERHLTREARDGIRLLKELQAARRAHVDGTACIEVGTILDAGGPSTERSDCGVDVPEPSGAAVSSAVDDRQIDGAPGGEPPSATATTVERRPAAAGIRRVL